MYQSEPIISSSSNPVETFPEAARKIDRVPVLGPLHRLVAAGFAVIMLITVVLHFGNYVDYVGADNDDVMRLVQVRDLLGGQGWFDLVQTRLGLEDGTPMHWSRLIDLPIALLVALFSLVLAPQTAEAAALFVWPSLTMLPILYALALGARSLGGPVASVVGLIAGVLFVMSVNRFQPGSIDHHNVQLAIVAVIAACLTLPDRSPRAFGVAGFAAALAVAIGAETTPHVAIACAIVAVLWLWHGEAMRAAACAFALAMAASLTAVFYLTVPPTKYSLVACDALSTSFYALGVVGAGGLFLAAALASGFSRPARLAMLGSVATGTAGFAVLIAPACLGNPLASLDPLLVDMWLNSVTEAQPVLEQIGNEPWTAGGFYAVPLIAMAVCLFNIRRNRKAEAHMVLLALIATAYAIALVQVRGAVFSNLLSAIPLAGLVSELRARSHAAPKNTIKGLQFAGTALASIPFVWALSGALLSMGYTSVRGEDVTGLPVKEKPVCTDAAAMAPLANEPKGVVVNASNLGAHILRFTHHRSLSAPYHRNQGGMLTELHAGLATPQDAEKFLRGAGATLVAFCRTDPQVGSISRRAPAGFYAELSKGNVPAWLEPVPQTIGKPLEIYRLRP